MSMDLCLTVNESSGMSTFQENSSDVSLYPPSDYPFQYQVISVIIGIVIFLVGMLGNILVIVVVCRTKCMHTPTNCYLLSLSVADCLVLLSATLPSIPEPFFHTGEWPWGRITCSVLIFLQYLGVQASSLSITMFTIERYIAICHPMRAQRMCTVQRAKRIIIAIWIFTTLYCAPWLGLTAVVENEKTGIPQCVHRLEREKYLAYYLTDLIAFYVVPLLVSGILYALIARILFINTMPRSKSEEQHCTKDKFRVKTSTSNSRKQVVRMLIVIFGVFAILWMPYRVMVVYNSFASIKYHDPWFLLFCRIMVYINSAINPILYNAMSVKFRRAFQNILCCAVGKYKHGSDAYSEYTTDQRAAIRLNKCAGMERSYLLMPPNIKKTNSSMESITFTESDGCRAAI